MRNLPISALVGAVVGAIVLLIVAEPIMALGWLVVGLLLTGAQWAWRNSRPGKPWTRKVDL